MSLSGTKGRLSGTQKELALRWAETKNCWRDAKSREFEKKFLEDLWLQLDRTLTVMDKMDELLRKIENDCE